MTKLNISDIPLTRSEIMNQDHKEFVEILRTILELLDNSNNEGDIDAALEHLHTHLKEHFTREEEMMVKANFPPYPVHKAEHDRVLTLYQEAVASWQSTHNREQLTNLMQVELPEWFIQHVSTMDKVTAEFVESSGKL